MLWHCWGAVYPLKHNLKLKKSGEKTKATLGWERVSQITYQLLLPSPQTPAKGAQKFHYTRSYQNT